MILSCSSQHPSLLAQASVDEGPARPEGHLLAAHPSLLAQASVDDAPPPANWQPTTAGPVDCLMRVPYAGRLDDLADARGKEPRRAAYRQTAAEPDDYDDGYPQSVFSDQLIIFEATAPGLDLPAAGPLAAAFRSLIMAQCPEPIPEWVSGHTPDGGRSQGPRIALLPLASVGRAHADGRITRRPPGVPPLHCAASAGPTRTGASRAWTLRCRAPCRRRKRAGACITCSATTLTARSNPILS